MNVEIDFHSGLIPHNDDKLGYLHENSVCISIENIRADESKSVEAFLSQIPYG